MLEVIAQAVPDLELRPDMVTALHAPVSGKPDANASRHHPLLVAEADESILSGDPVSLCVLQMSITLRVGCVLHDAKERTLAPVVVLGMIHVDDSLPFHVGLPGEEEDFEGIGLGFGLRHKQGGQ